MICVHIVWNTSFMEINFAVCGCFVYNRGIIHCYDWSTQRRYLASANCWRNVNEARQCFYTYIVTTIVQFTCLSIKCLMRCKHIDVKLHFVNDVISNGNVRVEKIAAEENPADVLTKSFPTTKFRHCLDLVNSRENLWRPWGVQEEIERDQHL